MLYLLLYNINFKMKKFGLYLEISNIFIYIANIILHVHFNKIIIHLWDWKRILMNNKRVIL